MNTQLFEDTEDGRQRSIMFAMVTATAALCIVTATVSALAASGSSVAAGVFAFVGACLFVLAVYIHQGGLSEMRRETKTVRDPQ